MTMTVLHHLTLMSIIAGLLGAGCSRAIGDDTGAGGGSGCETPSDGMCVGCATDADCGISTACTVYRCVAPWGLCSTGYVWSGQGDPGGQTAGDCKKIACDGHGGTVIINDDGDAPDDGNPCTSDACANGVALHAPLPAGTTCGAGLTCDAGGGCGGCLTDADCAAVPGCVTYHCEAGACVDGHAPNGTFCEDAGPFDPYPGVCSNGSCFPGCFVNGEIWPALFYGADCEVCASCDPQVSRTSLYAGGCHVNGVSGGCGGDGVCYLGFPECETGCADCSLTSCGPASIYGSPADLYTPCADDGNPCTADACDGWGGCYHAPVTNGTACGAGLVCMNGACVPGSP